MSTNKLTLAASLASAIALVSTSSAWAQTSPNIAPNDGVSSAGDIVVTARKRSEDVLKTPVAVSVVTSEDIAKKGITSLADLATNTPGVTINNNSSGRADRSFQQIIIRGFTPSTSLATTVSTFIDGAPVSSPTALTTISDPARIETLKGPQSAYFGRNTFAGAVNVVNKEPTGKWGGELLAMGGNRNSYRLHAALEGPIIGDALTFRVAADKFGKDGSYRNTFTGGTLGDQSSKSVNALIVAKPVQGLTVKLFGLYSEDHDGPAAQGLIGAYSTTDTNTGKTVVANQSNCTLNGLTSGTPGVGKPATYQSICGVAPALSSVAPSANTALTQNVKDFLAKSTGRIFAGANGVQSYGLLRRYHHAHAAVDYQIADTGVTLSSITAMNGEGYSTLVDLDNYGSTSFDYPFLIERRNRDFSQEVRANYDKGGPFKATVGGSYLINWVQADLGGSFLPLSGITASSSGETKSRTKGAFFALSYKFDRLTLNGEGRYQVDTLYAYNDPYGKSELTHASYNNFLPRAIAQFDFDRNTMVYASWAKGVNPGQFNTSFLTSPAATVALAKAAGINVAVRPEKVTNYEIGIKGKLLDGHLRYALDGYYAQWRDQINSIGLAVLDPVTGSPQLVQGTANTGNVNMKGIEFETSYTASSLITLNAAAAFNGTDIRSYASPTISKLTGIFDFSGKEMPNISKWSATAGIQFGGHVVGAGNASWFARADYAFKSGVWSNPANILRTPAYNNVNLRVGTTIDQLSLDIFVNNVFNDNAYTSISDQFVFTPTFAYTSTNSALIVGLRERRSAGVQAKLKF